MNEHSDSSAIAAVILAAGQSKRMKSDTPKVLHEACGRPMIEYVLDAARQAGATRLIVVVGHKAEMVKAALSHHADVEFALQAEQKGTGHAVMMCREQLRDHDGPILVLTGDTPLLRGTSLKALLDEQREHRAACVVGTARTEQNQGLGRIVRDADGQFVRIVEQKDASPDELAITEIKPVVSPTTVVRCSKRWTGRPNNNQGEYYLTDCAEILRTSGRTGDCRLQARYRRSDGGQHAGAVA